MTTIKSSSSPSSSWVVPFVLGATTALSVVYLQNKFMTSSSSSSSSKTTNRNVTNNSSSAMKIRSIDMNNGNKNSNSNSNSDNDNNSNNNNDNNDNILMDAADLDQRMLRKAEAVLLWRTTRLVLVIERCTNDHNYSAILRTAEALGIQNIYMIDPPIIEEDVTQAKTQKQQFLVDKATPEELEQRRQHHFFARNAQEWLTIFNFSSTEECVDVLKQQQGYQLWVTDLSQQAECLTMTTPTIPDRVALVMGTEAVGCSQYMLDNADKRVYLPLRGFADSLNLSVATALVIHQLFVMDPTLIGNGMSPTELQELRLDWYTKLCQQRLLTNSQKKLRLKLISNIQRCQLLLEKQSKNKKNHGKPLQASEQAKLDELPKLQAQLDELNALVDPIKVQKAVQEWVQNPPKPLTDVRRADMHRICYVGKNTKQYHQDHWKDMVATSNVQTTIGQTAFEFRQKVVQTEKEGEQQGQKE